MCKNYHLNKNSGRLTGEYLKEVSSDFGVLFSKNIIQHKEAGIGGWTEPLVAPDPSDKVNYGRYLVVAKWGLLWLPFGRF